MVFGDQDIDLGPPNYFQDGDRRGPSTRLGIEAILGPRGERKRERQRGVFLLSLGLAYPMATDAWPIGHARGPASKRFRTVFVDMSLDALADFCTGDTRKIAVDNRFLASVRRCCINLASVPTSFRKVNIH